MEKLEKKEKDLDNKIEFSNYVRNQADIIKDNYLAKEKIIKNQEGGKDKQIIALQKQIDEQSQKYSQFEQKKAKEENKNKIVLDNLQKMIS